jgi:hypothetical protein
MGVSPTQVEGLMTQEESDALVGRTLREHKEAIEKIGTLKAQAEKLGRTLYGLGSGLVKNPESVTFDGEGMDGRFPRTDFASADLNLVTADYIRRLCREIRQAIIERERLAKQLTELGYRL